MKQRRKSQAAVINPLVVDLSHHNDVADFGAVKAAGDDDYLMAATAWHNRNCNRLPAFTTKKQ
jgi:hypothetical protein